MQKLLTITVFFIGIIAISFTDAITWAKPKEPDRDLLLVVNKGDQSLSIVDPEQGREIAVVPVGGVTGHEVAVSPDGRTAWVPIYGNSGVGKPGIDGRTISLIDLDSHSQIANIDLGAASRPHAAVFGPRDGKLYVTAELTNSIKVIDPSTRKVISTIETGARESHMLAISSDGLRAYTSNVGAGTISAIDLRTKHVIASIPVARVIQRVAISKDDRWIFTTDQTAPRLAVIDARKGEVSKWVPLRDMGFSIAPTHDGRRLLITHPSSRTVSILNLGSMKIEREIQVPAEPQEVLVRPDDRVAYISCDESKQVVAVNPSTGEIEKRIAVGAGADGLAWVPRSSYARP
jgi:YVTN family beta-propeller protein